jgi:hypothetical protein
VRAIAGTGASDGLGEDFVGFLCGAWFAAGIHFGEILPQLPGLLLPPLLREGRGLNSADADSRLSRTVFWSGERSLALRIMDES